MDAPRGVPVKPIRGHGRWELLAAVGLRPDFEAEEQMLPHEQEKELSAVVGGKVSLLLGCFRACQATVVCVFMAYRYQEGWVGLSGEEGVGLL